MLAFLLERLFLWVILHDCWCLKFVVAIHLELCPDKLTVFGLLINDPPETTFEEPLDQQTVVSASYICSELPIIFEHIALLLGYYWVVAAMCKVNLEEELAVVFHFVLVDAVKLLWWTIGFNLGT